MAKTKTTRKAATVGSAVESSQKPIGGEILFSALPQPQSNAKGEIWCPLAKEGIGEWRKATTEELVRQGFVLLLKEHYGDSFEQMRQERRTQSGTRSPRVDIVVWATAQARIARESPKLVVECKAENVAIHIR